MNDSTPTTCTCPSGNGSLRHPCPSHPFLQAISHEQAIKLARAAAYSHCNQHSYLPQTWEVAATWQPHDWVISAIMVAADAAAPVDTWFADQLTAMGEVIPLASTPAAPGIDLGQFHALACFGEEFALSAERQPQSRVVYSQAKRLLALIDASPKGGSTDAKDAARWRVAREQNGVTISVEEADDDGDMQFVSGHTPEELDAAMDAMQATSAEVKP